MKLVFAIALLLGLFAVAQATAPADPANLIQATISATRVDLRWTHDGTGVTLYRLQRKVSNGGSFADVGTPAVTNYSDTSATASKDIAYRVRAEGAGGNSNYIYLMPRPRSSDNGVGRFSRLTADITTGSTTLLVGDTSGFPASGLLTIGAELIFYTGTTATSVTGCTRGANGTSAAAHATFAAVYSPLTDFPLTATLTDVATSLTSSRSGYIPPTCDLLIDSEVIAWSSGTLTRGAYGTTAVAHSSGTYFTVLPAVTTPATGITLTTVRLYPGTRLLDKSKSLMVVAVALDQNGYDMPQVFFDWGTSNSAVATLVTSTKSGGGTSDRRMAVVQGVGAGTANLTATVGGVTSNNCALVVKDPAASPSASIAADNLSAGTINTFVNEPIDLNFEGSTGLNTNLVDWGDGLTTSDEASATHAYWEAGTYTVTLTVTNSSGSTNSTTISVIVAAIPAGTVNTTVTDQASLLSVWNAISSAGNYTIRIAAGTVITGETELPAKTFAAYVTIETSGTLPNIKKRIDPSADAAQLVTFRSTTANGAALTILNSQTHLRMRGIKIENTNSFGTYTGLLVGDSAQTSTSTNPSMIIFEQCVISQADGIQMVHGFINNGYKVSAVSCTFENIASVNSEAQAIWGLAGKGAHVYRNNKIEGAGENFMYGGSTSSADDVVATDIEFRQNWFTKRAGWQSDVGHPITKNLFETKMGRRVYVSGNVFNYDWFNGGQIYAFAVKSSNQDSGAPWMRGEDVTIENNYMRHLSGGINTQWDLYYDSVCPAPRNVRLKNNLWTDVSSSWSNDPGNLGFGKLLYVGGSIDDFLIQHNTGVSESDALSLDPGNDQRRGTFINNVLGLGHYGFLTTSYAGAPIGGLNASWGSTWTVNKNVLVAYGANVGSTSNTSLWPNTGGNLNSYPAAISDVGFTDATNYNYSLAGSSAYKNTATDGTDPGINSAALQAAVGASSASFATATFKAVTGDWTGGPPACKWGTSPACQ